MSKSKTMTATQFINHLHKTQREFGQCALQRAVEQDGPITLIPEPAPRPDFSRMSGTEKCKWIFDNYDKGDYRTNSLKYINDFHAELRRMCNDIADGMGLAEG